MIPCHIRRIFSWLLLIGSLVLFILGGWGTFSTKEAAAVINQLQPAPQQILYRSQNSLLDSTGKSWQVVLFKQVTADETNSLSLRLVGFPGAVEFLHPQPLELKTDTGSTWQAQDSFSQDSPAANVGQYDLTKLTAQLPRDASLTLSLPLKNQPGFALKIPSSIVHEWQTL